jgi:hypothetical protein
LYQLKTRVTWSRAFFDTHTACNPQLGAPTARVREEFLGSGQNWLLGQHFQQGMFAKAMFDQAIFE